MCEKHHILVNLHNKNFTMKNKSDIFRLAAVLYADSNDDVSTEKVYRRIIESIFIDNENKKLTFLIGKTKC